MAEDEEWSLKKYYLVDDVSYYPDCNHNIVSEEDINNHNSIADDLVDCPWCKGTGFESHHKYLNIKDKDKPIEIKWYHNKDKKCAFCEGSGKQKRHNKMDIQSSAYYKSEDIETLREKLIEDIKSYRDFSGPNHANVLDMIDIINRRFGIE